MADQYRTYSPCCPANDNRKSNATNIYTLEQQCAYIACFTDNEGIAKSFEGCVQNQTDVALVRMRKDGTVPLNATTANGGYGRCEYIDFKELKKGVLNDAGARRFVTTQGLFVFAIGMAVVFCF
jgi:hypothetical protein